MSCYQHEWEFVLRCELWHLTADVFIRFTGIIAATRIVIRLTDSIRYFELVCWNRFHVFLYITLSPCDHVSKEGGVKHVCDMCMYYRVIHTFSNFTLAQAY